MLLQKRGAMILSSHPSLGYAFFLAMGAFCFPDSIIGVNIINLILVEFAKTILMVLVDLFAIGENVADIAKIHRQKNITHICIISFLF